MRVKDVMTPNPNACVPEDTSGEAARIMRDKNVGMLPVVETQSLRKLIGVVTDRDLCLAVLATGRHPDSVKIREVMSEMLVTCRPDDDLEEVVDRMQQNQVRRIPVIDDHARLLGMVSTGDLVQRAALGPDTVHRTFQKLTEPTDQASRPRADMARQAG